MPYGMPVVVQVQCEAQRRRFGVEHHSNMEWLAIFRTETEMLECAIETGTGWNSCAVLKAIARCGAVCVAWTEDIEWAKRWGDI